MTIHFKIFKIEASKEAVTAVAYDSETTNILVGDANGIVSIYNLKDMR